MGRCTPTIWYRFRRWLVRKLVPPNMTVFCFDGMENIGGSIILCLSRMSPEEWKSVGDKILEIADEIKEKRKEGL